MIINYNYNDIVQKSVNLIIMNNDWYNAVDDDDDYDDNGDDV